MLRWRPFPHFSWDLRACGRHGHATYAPDEPDLRDRLHVTTAAGEAWRCLRCGDFVAGAPRGSGPADDAPIVLRGRALRDAFVLRLLAVERGLRGVLLIVLAYALQPVLGRAGVAAEGLRAGPCRWPSPWPTSSGSTSRPAGR